MLMEASLSLTKPTRLAEEEQEREGGLGEGKPSGGSRQVQRPVHTRGVEMGGGEEERKVEAEGALCSVYSHRARLKWAETD